MLSRLLRPINLFKKIFRMEEKATAKVLGSAEQLATAAKLGHLSEVDR